MRRRIAIIGTGPTGSYAQHALVQRPNPWRSGYLSREAVAGRAKPYGPQTSARYMLADADAPHLVGKAAEPGGPFRT
jgi:uncharacterized NAD(P)/FAD-binding protein YdhS